MAGVMHLTLAWQHAALGLAHGSWSSSSSLAPGQDCLRKLGEAWPQLVWALLAHGTLRVASRTANFLRESGRGECGADSRVAKYKVCFFWAGRR